jgi:hypothetical protein
VFECDPVPYQIDHLGQGKRCLLVATGGKTVARQRTGGAFLVFSSALPNGGAASHGRRAGGGGRCGGMDYTILDCIYIEETAVFFVCDVMCSSPNPRASSASKPSSSRY